jgi:predicted ATPase
LIMALIEGFRVQNYRALKDITIGKLWNQQTSPALTPLVAVIGKNGVGKSTLFDAFGFISDCLSAGVEEACDLKERGGFNRLVSSGSDGPIHFDIYYRESPGDRPITFELSIERDGYGRPYVAEERLRQRRKGQKSGRPLSFLQLKGGEGQAWAGEESFEGEDSDRIRVELTDTRKLGVATLGTLETRPRIAKFRQFLESWYLSYFTPDSARSLPMAGPQKHLNMHGDNLGNVVQYMEREHKARFQSILNRIASKIPGIEKIDTRKTDDGRLLLRFNDRGFQDPFLAQQMSDGTLKMFAYMLLLEDPDPAPFICIEKPENGLYHKLLETLAREFRARATGKKNAPQIILLDRLPMILAGYRKSQQHQDAAVLVVVDLDDRNCAEFKQELNGILNQCHPAPRALFRIAIEEMEAWLLGDRSAILKEFPRAKGTVLGTYDQDSICGTWERLTDAVFPGGSAALKVAGGPEIGEQKCKWASQIGRHLDPESNASPGFHALRRGLLKLCGQAEEA